VATPVAAIPPTPNSLGKLRTVVWNGETS
jgi:hypothetical protein